jgi:hypothetical protein
MQHPVTGLNWRFETIEMGDYVVRLKGSLSSAGRLKKLCASGFSSATIRRNMEENVLIDGLSFEDNFLMRRMILLKSSQNVNLNIIANLGSNGIIRNMKAPFSKKETIYNCLLFHVPSLVCGVY